MLLVKDLDVALATKLGDPVHGPGEDGQLYPYDLRLGYLQRATAKLARDLPKLMGKYTPLFANSYELHSQDIGTGTSIVRIEDEESQISKSLEDVQEVFVTVTKSNKDYAREKATWVEHENYLSMINGTSSAYEASFDNKRFYYTILSNEIYLIPAIGDTIDPNAEVQPASEYQYTKIEMTLRSEPSTLTLESELEIGKDYEDLILSMASLEGMQDIARIDKAQLYTAEISNQLRILQGYANLKTQKEGSEVNG